MSIFIRKMLFADSPMIADSFRNQGWNKPVGQYDQYFREQESGQRAVLLAFLDNIFAGYGCILWNSPYPFFRKTNIPEIADLNVLIKYQKQGIASRLLDECERIIFAKYDTCGIGVGLTKEYGPAQILYVKRGYIPDGRGLFQNETPVSLEQMVNVDHDLVLYLLKNRTSVSRPKYFFTIETLATIQASTPPVM